MATETQTILSQREITANGTIQIRLEKQVVSNGAIVTREYHRFSMSPGTLLDVAGDGEARKLSAFYLVDRHLGALGFPPIRDADKALIRAMANAEWTPKVVAAFRAAQAPS